MRAVIPLNLTQKARFPGEPSEWRVRRCLAKSLLLVVRGWKVRSAPLWWGKHLSIVWRGLEWSQRLGKRLPGLHQLIIEKLIWITYKQMLISRQSNDAFLMNGTHQKARFCARSVWLGVELESTQFGILTVWFMMTCCLVTYNLDPIFKTDWMMLTSTSDFKISFQ